MGGREQRATFGAEAEVFEDVLGLLCQRSPAVTLVLRSGIEIGAVLIAVDSGAVTFERWDATTGQPSG